MGAVDRALHELLNLDVYDRLGLEVDAYDTAPGPLEVLRALRRPLQRVLGRGDPATWNDDVCRARPRLSSCSARPHVLWVNHEAEELTDARSRKLLAVGVTDSFRGEIT